MAMDLDQQPTHIKWVGCYTDTLTSVVERASLTTVCHFLGRPVLVAAGSLSTSMPKKSFPGKKRLVMGMMEE